MPTTYVGSRVDGVCKVQVVRTEDGTPIEELTVADSLKLRNHSPTGFEWGYGGSGPSQLALALLLHASKKPKASLASYQDFKTAVVTKMPQEGWLLRHSEVEQWLQGKLPDHYFDTRWPKLKQS